MPVKQPSAGKTAFNNKHRFGGRRRILQGNTRKNNLSV
jgi:hypothetical protein